VNANEWTGPFARERERAEALLETGEDEIEYRGVSFFVNDNDRGWTYVRNRREYTSLDAVLDAIDEEANDLSRDD
jgi:hypothetical protein